MSDIDKSELTPEDEKAQQIISDFLADDLAYFHYGNSFKNLTADQKATMLFATVELARKIQALITQQCNQARKDLLNDLKQVTFNAVMSDKDAHGATEDYIAAELAQAKETKE